MSNRNTPPSRPAPELQFGSAATDPAVYIGSRALYGPSLAMETGLIQW
jgi:hypothetical protein